MLTRSLAPTSATSSAAPRLPKPSQYAIGSTPDIELGRYGAVLLKPWTPRAGAWRVGERLMPGTVIPGDVASAWPVHNRLAMRENRFVRFFLSPDEAVEAGPKVAALAQEHPELAQAEASAADNARLRHIEQLAAARRAKAEKRRE